MILKKPYAFLIKNFRIIHIIIFTLMLYISSCFNNIPSFYRNYSSNNFYDYNIAKNYLPTLGFISIIIILFAFATLIYLMNKKKKPYNLYIFSIIYYFIIIIGMFIAYENINTLYDATLTQKISRTFRDVYLILSLPQYYFLIMYLLRGIGFDIKKFNFSKDLEELEIKSDDNEEFEFIVGNETYLIKRKIHRIYREIIYYYKENAFFINIAGATIGAILIVTLFLNVSSNLKRYHIGSTLNADKFIYKLNNAYVTENDYKGNRIKANAKYIIIDLTITNKSAFTLKEEDIYILYGNNRAIHKKNLSETFSDIGKVYKGEPIPNSPTKYLFVFEIPKHTNVNHLKMLTFKGYENKDGIQTHAYREYVFKAKKIDKKLPEIISNLNNIYPLGTNLYGNSNIKIKNIEIKDKYEYNYEKCYNENYCETLTDIINPINKNNNQLLIIDYELNIDKSSLLGYITENQSLIINKFSKISYNLKEEQIIQNIYGQIYESLPNKIFYDIPKKINNNKPKYFIIKSRENNYIYQMWLTRKK